MPTTQTLNATGLLSGDSQTLPFAQFDPASGDLQGISVGLTGAITGGISLTNLDGNDSEFTFTLPSTIAVSDEGSVLASVSLDPIGLDLVSAGQSDTISSITATGTNDVTLAPVQLGGLTNFVGTGTVPLATTAALGETIDGPGNFDVVSHATADATVALAYNATGGGSGTDAGGGVVIVTDPVTPILALFGAETTVAQTITLADAVPGAPRPFNIARFDPSLGTLVEVDVRVVGDVLGSVAVENEGDTAQGITATVGANLTLDGPGLGIQSILGVIGSDGFSLGAFDGAVDFAGTSGRTDTGIAGTGTKDILLSKGVDLSPYVGAGQLALTLDTVGLSTLAGSGDMAAHLRDTAGEVVSVSYVYDPALACFAAGTRLLTARGHLPVEHVVVGERLVLATGGAATAVWVGRRVIDCDRHPDPTMVWPVRVRAGAFGDAPTANLLLSPDHALFLDGVLIPVRLLLTPGLVEIARVSQVTYFHVELPRHDVVLAEGLPAESYLDTGHRGAFDGVARIGTPSRSGAAERHADLVIDGPVLARARAALRSRAIASNVARAAA